MRVIDIGQTTVRILIVEFHRAHSFQDDALRDLEFFVFHSARHAYDHLLFVVRCRNFQRFNLRFHKSWNANACAALLFVEFPCDG